MVPRDPTLSALLLTQHILSMLCIDYTVLWEGAYNGEVEVTNMAALDSSAVGLTPIPLTIRAWLLILHPAMLTAIST